MLAIARQLRASEAGRMVNFVMEMRIVKEELIEKVSHIHETLKDLNDLWRRLDWSIVPEEVNEHYPFHQYLEQMKECVAKWLEIIKKS